MHPRIPGWGGGESCISARPHPTFQDSGRGREVVLQGVGAEISGRGRGRLRMGRGQPGAQAPPPARAGREGEAVASADRAKRSGGRGGGCRPRPGGTQRVGAGS